ncbi:MAG TPA: thermonuclease family protein [Candidatus Hydrogenedentes bacterium]|nr:thermonuclease family protein [Candidatus Hydrogenedentota bacterium]
MGQRFFLAMCLTVAVLFSAVSPAKEVFTGRVVGVSDGDTLSVMREGKAVRVRLWGIDAPEGHQAFGGRAKRFVSDACFGREATVTVKDIDRYKRLVGLVLLEDGRILNQELVRAGLAWWYERYAPNEATLRGLQAEARQAKRGLWQDLSPMPPWEFRKNGSSARKSGQGADTRNSAGIVYVTRTGNRYHRKQCSMLSRSGIPVPLEEARKRGLTPCGHCRP